MAADTAVTGTSSDCITRLVRKIIRAPDGTLGAAAGPFSICAMFREWVAGGMETSFVVDCEEGAFGAILARPDGRVERIEHQGRRWTEDADTPFHIEGCATALALGALLTGATAAEAVGICIEHHAYCAGPLQVERLIRSDAPVLAHAGEILVCENDHPLYRLRTDIGPVNPSDKSPFEPAAPEIAEQDPQTVNPDCPVCGASWIRSGPNGLSFKVQGEEAWRSADAG